MILSLKGAFLFSYACQRRVGGLCRWQCKYLGYGTDRLMGGQLGRVASGGSNLDIERQVPLLEVITNGRELYAADVAELPPQVQTWMIVMRVSFFSGIVFCLHRPAARWIVLAMALTALALFAGKGVWPTWELHELGGLTHLLLWPLALILAWRARKVSTWINEPAIVAMAFQLWLYWASLLILISLVLDVMALIIS